MTGSTGMVPIQTTTGVTNLGGISGWTGMTGTSSPPKCEVCEKIVSNYVDCTLNFDNKITSSNDVHRVCLPCYQVTKKLIKKSKKDENEATSFTY